VIITLDFGPLLPAAIRTEGEVTEMGKLRIGSCPRCKKGEVFIDRDHYGWYECCLQCGYSRDLPDIAPAAAAGRESTEAAAVKTREGRPVRLRRKT
jgi:hypothetical protein